MTSDRQQAQSTIAPVTWPQPAELPWSPGSVKTVLDILSPALTAGGARPAVIFDDGSELSCEAWLDHTEQLAGHLATRISPGDRVALAIGNRAEFLIAFFAIIANRAIAVTLSPGVGRHDAEYLIRDSQSVLAIAEDGPADILEGLGDACPQLKGVLRVQGAEPAGLAHHYRRDRRIRLNSVGAQPGDLIKIGYTSGTTGLPKALGAAHTGMRRYVENYLQWHGLRPEDRVLCPLQFHYGDPLWLLLSSVAMGTPLIVARRFSVSRFWQTAHDFRATQLFSIGAIPTLLLSAPPSPADRRHRVHSAVAVGVPADRHQELIDRFGFPWIEGYGLSESGPAIAMPAARHDDYVGTGALGIPFPGVEARLVDQDGVAIEGEGAGELELGGTVDFHGYLNNTEATAEVLHDDWLRTGDLMRRDLNGVYYFLGRRKELIRRGGENIAPAEVESVLRLHPSVIDAAVVPVPDDLRGEEIKAYVEVRQGNEPSMTDLVAFCRERLAAFKVPRYVELRYEPFPRTPSQRIPKNQLKVDGAHQTSTAWDREAVRPRPAGGV